MTRALRTVLATALAGPYLGLSCSTSSVDLASFWIPDQADSMALAAFQIVDQGFHDALADSRSSEEFQQKIDTYSRNGISIRDIRSRIEYCAGNLETPLQVEEGRRDIRWELYLTHGEPTGEWILPGEELVGSRIDSVTYWLYQWEDGTTELVRGARYPTRYAQPTRQIRWERSPLYLESAVSVCPANEDGLHPILICAAVPILDINSKSFARKHLIATLSIRGGFGLAYHEIDTIHLNPFNRIARVADNTDELRVPCSFTTVLPSGTYEMHFRMYGGDDNWGEVTRQINVPSPQTWGMSDLVVIRPNPPVGSLAPTPIRLWGRSFHPWPVRTYLKGSRMMAMAEVIVAPRTQYNLVVSLIPKPQKTRRSDGEHTDVVVGEIQGVDPVEGERYESDWNWPKSPAELLDHQSVPKRAGATLFSGRFTSPDAYRHVLVFPVEFDVPSGDYWMKTYVADTLESRYFAISITDIEVAAGYGFSDFPRPLQSRH